MNCRKCGKCCSNILPLYDEDIKKIRQYKKLKENKLIVDNNWYMRCPFLNNKNECDIYENRPFICRTYDCQKFNDNVYDYDEEFIKKVTIEKARIINMREYFFGGKK